MAELNFYSHKESDLNADNGPRTAAVLTFSGDTNDSFVKELTQNSLDARVDRDGKLKIKVSFKKILKTSIPNFNQFEIKLGQMEKYWNDKGRQYNKFFETSRKSIKGNEVNILVFDDSLTKGLTGDDSHGTFKNCVNDENVSGKDHSDSLGNHGIGKNSIFGYSGIHTVFYSSLNESGEYKFKGVSKLGSYKDENDILRTERIYYGAVEKESVGLIDNQTEIPECFRRKENGLSQFVIGAETNDNWAANIKKAFISNYWFLFENGKLEVEVDDDILNHDNYEAEAEIIFTNIHDRENPLQYIKAYKKGLEKSENIFKIGKVKLFIIEAEENDKFYNKITFLRSGMKIKLDNLEMSGLPLNIAGVMFCDNVFGNTILGAMEPHAHNDFKPELVAKKEIRDVSVEDAKRILKEIKNFKKKVLSELLNKYTQESESIDVVDNIFQSILGNGKGSGLGKTIKSLEETFNRKSYKVDYDGEFSSNSRNGLTDNLSDVDYGDGNGPGVGTGDGGKGIHGGKGKKNGKGGGANNLSKKVKGINNKNISARFFISEVKPQLNIYKLILRADEDISSFNVIIGQHGDSGKKKSAMSSTLSSVKQGVKEIKFYQILDKKEEIIGYKLQNLSIKNGDPSVYEIQMNEKSASALKILEVI